MKKPSKIRRVMNRSKFSEFPKGMIVIRRKNRKRKPKVISRPDFVSIVRDAECSQVIYFGVNYKSINLLK